MTVFNQTTYPKAEDSENGVLVSLPIDAVIPRNQVRKQFTNLDELAISIKTQGLQMPISVMPDKESGRYLILQGERRWRASKLAGLETIDAIVRKPFENDDGRIIAQLTENIQREEMTCEEIAKAIANLHDNGYTLAEIGKSLGKNADWARIYHSVAELPEFIERIRREHDIKDPYVLSPLKKMFMLDEIIAKETIEDALLNQVKLTRSFARALYRNLKWRLDHQEAEDKEDSRENKVISSMKNGMVPASEVLVHCCVMPIGENRKYYGVIANDRVMKDPEFICVNVNGQYKVVSTKEIVIVGVKDRAAFADDVY